MSNKNNFDPNTVENNDQITAETPEVEEVEAVASDTDEQPGVLILEGENPEESPSAEENVRPATYMPRFTEASEKYRQKGDAKIRERLGIKAQVENSENENPDEIKLDPTAEFEVDVSGTQDAKIPENVAVDESDESIHVMKFSNPDDELEREAEKEREEIKKLLNTESKPEPTPEPQPEADDEPVAEDEPQPEVEEAKEYELPDPDIKEFEVFEFEGGNVGGDVKVNAPTAKTNVRKAKKANENEFSNPIQRDGIKDRFLDSLISIRIRLVASVIFTIAILALEILTATGYIKYGLFEGSSNYANAGIVDFLLGTCMFIMTAPEIIRSIKNLANKKLTADFLTVPVFLVFGAYTLTVSLLTSDVKYALMGVLFAASCLPVLTASLYRTKADFIAFKMIAQPEDKQAIDVQNTRDFEVENKALDGAVDEYKSKFARTFTTSFVSDFFKNSEGSAISKKQFGFIFGIPFGIGLVAGVAFYFLFGLQAAMSVFALVVMLGCPAFSILVGKVAFFHSQRAALLTDSTAIGEDAYRNFSGVDVFAFDDTDIFGPDDVNLKRFMLYGDRENMDKIMRQMCALFAAVGGPLDYMFSGIIDNRVRHKTASNVIIEDDGLCGEVGGRKVYAGSEDYMRRNGIAIPAAAIGKDSEVSLDTIKVMYAAEDGEVNAKFYIRYSFSEEFTSTIPSLKDAGIIPLVYTRDPNVNVELMSTLSAGNGVMRVVKLYHPSNEVITESRTSARMVTYGDRLDAASMIVLAKKFSRFSAHLRFAERSAAIIGIVIAIALSFIGLGKYGVLIASLWQTIMCTAIRLLSKSVFLKDAKKKSADH